MEENKVYITEENRSKLLNDIKTVLSGVRVDEARSILKSIFQYIENIGNATKL